MSQTELYKITSWTENAVTAELMDPECRTAELKLSVLDKSVTTVTRQQGKCDGLLPDLKKPRFAVLISGKQLDRQRGL
jgi:hypothetical protein